MNIWQSTVMTSYSALEVTALFTALYKLAILHYITFYWIAGAAA